VYLFIFLGYQYYARNAVDCHGPEILQNVIWILCVSTFLQWWATWCDVTGVSVREHWTAASPVTVSCV